MNRLAGSRAGRWACVLWGGFAGGVALGFLAGAAAVGCAAASIAVAVLAALALRGRTRAASHGERMAGHMVAILTVVVAVTFVAGTIRGASAVVLPNPHRVDGHLGARPVAVVGTVRDTQPGGAGPVIVDVERVADSDTDVAADGGLLVSGPNVPAVAPGDRVEVDASGLRAPNLRPGPESAQTLERENVEAVAVSPLVSVTSHGGPSLARGVAWVQHALVTAVDAVLPEPQAALTLGIAFGIRQPLATEVRQPLQDAGLIHIVVVSGLKVVLVISMVSLLARGLGWSPRRTLLVAAPVIAVYVVLSGAGPAAVRSALMAGAANVARTGGRRTDPLPMLALVAAAMLGVDPPLVLDPGFQLSFLGTAGIVLIAEPLARRLPGPRLLVEPFAVTVAAQVATVPVMANTFGVIALLGPVANALVLPLLPGLIVLGVAGATLAAFLPGAGWVLLQLGGLGATLTVAIARVVAAVPGASLQVSAWPPAWVAAEVTGLVAAAAAAWVLRRRGGSGAAAEPRLHEGGGVAHACREATAKPRDRERQSRSRSRSRSVARSEEVRVGTPPLEHSWTRRRMVAISAGAALLAASTAGYAASRPDGHLHVAVLSTGASPAVLIRGADGSLA
ncbi:MAG: ComEC/Rec2 family competence protein, partial [Candidatus Dormibacteraeota bacterium]|nr:ComEC/Rec2 family competence protein [Candidatus Dormibacteraeota bacterium]